MSFPTNILDIDTLGDVEFFSNTFINVSGKVFIAGMVEIDFSGEVVNMDGVFVASAGKIFAPGMVEIPDPEVISFTNIFVRLATDIPRIFSKMVEFEIINIPPTSGNMFEIAIREPDLPSYPPIVRSFLGDILFDLNVGESSISMQYNDLGRDPTFETAVRISLFTDKRAASDDELPSYSRNLRGWWGDADLGSRLWLLSRSKNTSAILDSAKFYCLEALQWMIESGVCRRVTVQVAREGTYSIRFTIQIIAEESFVFNYRYNWKLQLLEN